MKSQSKLWGQERSTSCCDCSCPPEGPAVSHDLLIFSSILFKHTISFGISLFCHILLVLHVDFPVWSWNTSFPRARLPPSDHTHLLPITAPLSSYYPLLVSLILCQTAFVLPHQFFAFPPLFSTLFDFGFLPTPHLDVFVVLCFLWLPRFTANILLYLVCCVCLCFIYINDSDYVQWGMHWAFKPLLSSEFDFAVSLMSGLTSLINSFDAAAAAGVWSKKNKQHHTVDRER